MEPTLCSNDFPSSCFRQISVQQKSSLMFLSSLLSVSSCPMTSVPFLFLPCSWISSPLLLFWPHNLIFSLQSLYLPALATLPFLFPLSLLPYFHRWALSLHLLSPSSPPILICSSPWRKAQRKRDFFTSEATSSQPVGEHQRSQQAGCAPCGAVEAETAQRGNAGVCDRELHRCRKREKVSFSISGASLWQLQLRNAAGEQLELLWVQLWGLIIFVTVWRRKVEFYFLLFGRTGSELLQCRATKAKSDQQLCVFSACCCLSNLHDTWFYQIQDIWPMQHEVSPQFLSNNKTTYQSHCILKPSEGDLWIVVTLPKRIGASGVAAVSCSLVGHKEPNLIQLTLFVDIFGGSRWSAKQMAQSMSVMSQLMTPPVCTLKCACKNKTLTGGCGAGDWC